MTTLPDPKASRLVLIGVSQYHHLEDISAIENNLSALKDVLTSRKYCGLLPGNCAVVLNPSSATEMLDPVLEAAQNATDTLLLYYAGHGLLDSRRGDLHLTLTDSDPRRMYTTVRYDHVRDAFLESSRASRRIVILDCCYSGRALGLMASLASAVVKEASAEGTYVLAAVAENKIAIAPPGEKYTTFTRELLDIIYNGIERKGPLLDLDSVYLQLQAVRAKGLPEPQALHRNTAGQLGFVRNQAYHPSTGRLLEVPARNQMPAHQGSTIDYAARPSYPRLGPDDRAVVLAQLSQGEREVLVIGGGIVGAGIALDASTRGLSVGLLEARDFASGASSLSSKLFDGGLLDLERLRVSMVREALSERSLMMQRTAPHLIRPVSFLFPFTHHGWERAYLGAGATAYDMLGMSMGQVRGLPSHRQLTRSAAMRLVPAFKESALTGALIYWDAQVDDARYVVTVLRTAAANGAQIASRVQVTSLMRHGEQVTGVRAVDLESGDTIEIRAKSVISATGVWTDEIQEIIGGRGTISVRASKGVHLVVPRDRIHSSTGIILRTPFGVLFVNPWGRHWIIGTTDTDWSLDRARPAASRPDIDYLLGQLNRILSVPLTRDDVEGVYAGLRPLLAESQSTSKPSREHTVAHPVPGLVVVAGGKYATYRLMARGAVDAVAHGLDTRVAPSCTDRVPLAGADGFMGMWNARHALARSSGLHVARIEHLLHRYGSMIGEVLALIAADPDLGKPLTGADDYLRAEIVYAASHEGARHLDDVLARRTHASIETWDRGLSAAEEAASLMAGPMRWRPRQVARELENYRSQVEAERASQEAETDQDADAIRLGAPDIAPVVQGDIVTA